MIHGSLADTEHSTDVCLSSAAFCPKRFDATSFGGSDLAIVVTFTARSVGGAWCDTPPLRQHIGSVVGGCTEEQMVRSNAGRVIASVANEQSCGYFPLVQFPGDPVSPLMPTIRQHLSVTTPAYTLVDPAVIAFHDVCPELFLGVAAQSVLIAGSATEARASDRVPPRMKGGSTDHTVGCDARMSHADNVARVVS